jgi:cardiolipin synthase
LTSLPDSFSALDESLFCAMTVDTSHSNAKISIPNLITLGRVIAVPITFWLVLGGDYRMAFVVFVLAGISDAVDGYLAKRFDWRTELGAYLDPLADKLLIVSIYIALAARGELPTWLVIAVVSRDFLIIAGIMLCWLLDQPVRIKPLAVSKANTFAQLVLAALVLADLGFSLGYATAREALVWITGILTVLSLAAYARAWLLHMTASGPGTTGHN